jgi:hypothetical protein
MSLDPGFLRERLTELLAKTKGAAGIGQPGGFIGDKATWRRIEDDWRAGRIAFQAARDNAEAGLEALDAGELDLAEALFWEAVWLYAAALEDALGPDGLGGLAVSAGKRGRRGLADRNRRLAEAVAEQEELGLKGKAARVAAMGADPDLAEAFKGATDSTLKSAIATVIQKKSPKK